MEDGTLAIPEKVRGSKAAMNTIVSKYISSGLNEEHPYVFICHGDAAEQAEKNGLLANAKGGDALKKLVENNGEQE